MTNREQLAWALGFCDYSDEDDCSLAIIYGKDLKLLTDRLGRERED